VLVDVDVDGEAVGSSVVGLSVEMSDVKVGIGSSAPFEARATPPPASSSSAASPAVAVVRFTVVSLLVGGLSVRLT
jgi:hypothetical protein